MRHISNKLIPTIGLVMLLFFFMGQDECDSLKNNEAFQQMMQTISRKFQPPPGKIKLYISYLPFVDSRTKTTIIATERGQLINEFMVRKLAELQKHFPQIQVNSPGHIINNTDANNNKLINITFDPTLTNPEKKGKIISELMTPNKVDMIVTGHYFDVRRSPKISIRPLIIVKHNQKMITKHMKFAKEELFVADPASSKIYLSREGIDQLSQLLQYLLEQF